MKKQKQQFKFICYDKIDVIHLAIFYTLKEAQIYCKYNNAFWQCETEKI